MKKSNYKTLKTFPLLLTFNISLLTCFAVFSQGVAINTTGTAADASAILDVSSTSAGMLIPRMTKTQRNAIGSPAEGLLIYQTDDTVGFWYRSTGAWKLMGSGAGSSIANGTAAGNTLYWDGSQWLESSNIYNAGGSVGIGTNNPQTTAKLEINSTNSGLLIPRMTTSQRNLIVSPAEGLQIFNTTSKCFEYYAYGFWQQWHCATCFNPDDAGTISGNLSVCQGDNGINYSVPIINNANTYTWSYTGTGATINGNSELITIDFTSSATSGNLTVKGTNQCGDGVASSNFPITVNSIPSSPTAGIHTPSQTEIIWNWNSVQGAIGYKYNTINNYSSAIDNGTNTSYTQTGLTCNTSYTLYVWTYNSCGVSTSIELNATTLSCWSCNIGDSKEGGIVFYHDVANNKCYVAAITDQNSGEWGCAGTIISGTGTNIGTGAANTTKIVNSCSETNVVAKICDNLTESGFSDWFLPSKDELNQMYNKKSIIGNFNSFWYWNSSEGSSTNAWKQNFLDGEQYNGMKASTCLVRCIRRY